MGELAFKDNRYTLTIDGHQEVSCFQANGRFYLHGVISLLPKSSKDRETCLKKILQKNLGLAMTQRVSLCIEPDNDALGLNLTLPLQGLNEDIIEESLAEFANNFEYFLMMAHEEKFALPTMPTMIMP